MEQKLLYLTPNLTNLLTQDVVSQLFTSTFQSTSTQFAKKYCYINVNKTIYIVSKV